MRAAWLLLALLGCPAAEARAPASPVSSALTLVAVGDSARIYFSWTATGATYRYTVSALTTWGGGVWAGLPVNVTTAARAAAVIATNATADSADFVACVEAINAVGVSAPGCTASKRWRRPPRPPVVTFDSITLSIIPTHRVVSAGTVTALCVVWQFPNKHVVLRTQDRVRALSSNGPSCEQEYRQSVTDSAQRVTQAEQALADARIAEVWSSADTMIVKAAPSGGMLLPHPKYITRWRRWAVDRTPSPVESTTVAVHWNGQTAVAIVGVRSTGWAVEPTGKPCNEGSPWSPWDLTTALAGGRPLNCVPVAVASRE
jgi:hypothetical protein